MSKNEKEIKIKVDGKEWQDAKNQAYEKANKNIKIDGYRKGKAPKNIFINKYGKQRLLMDAADMLLQSEYEKVLDDNKDIEIVSQPIVDLVSLEDDYVEFLFTLITKPEAKLKKYKKLGVEKESVSVTSEEIENALKRTLDQYAEEVMKDVVENNDTAIIDFEGFKDGVAFEGGKGENYALTIGSNTFIPGFEEQLIGMKKGEEREIKVTFPEDYHSDELKGQKATFKVKVHEIKSTVIPDLTKEFFEDLDMDGIDSKEKLEKKLEEELKVSKENRNEEKFVDDLLNKAIENLEVELPDAMIDDEQNRILNQYNETLQRQGFSLEQFYKMTNSSKETLKEQMKPEAIKRIKSRYVLEEIAKAEEISITDDEALDEAKTLAKKYNMETDEFVKVFGGLDMVKYDLKMRKAIEILKNNN